MKRNYKIIYHAFTDNKDYITEKLKEAKEIIKKWENEGFENLRIYKKTYSSMLEYDECDGEEDCIFSKGVFPY